jgi:hypothetical protein
MYDSQGFVFSENFIKRAAIADVANLQRAPFDKLSMTVREVVINDRREAAPPATRMFVIYQNFLESVAIMVLDRYS